MGLSKLRYWQSWRRNTPTKHVWQTAHHTVNWILTWIAPCAHLIGHPFPHYSSLVLAPTWGFVPDTPTLLVLFKGCDHQTWILAWLKQHMSEVVPSSLLVRCFYGHSHSEAGCHWSSRGIYPSQPGCWQVATGFPETYILLNQAVGNDLLET